MSALGTLDRHGMAKSQGILTVSSSPSTRPKVRRRPTSQISSTTEGFGIVIVEALACGLPVVSTDCKGGPREILDDGESGLLVPVGDPESMAAAILRLIEDENLYREMSARATRRASDFDLPQTGSRILRILSSL